MTKHQSFWTIITTTKPSLIHANDCNIELQGLDQPSCQMLLEDSELQGTLADWDILVNKYRGNPQHLKIIANTIRDIFNGDISKFLATDVLISDQLKDCLSGQLDRLTNLETGMLLWIAILIQERSTVTIDRLRDKFNYLLTDLQIVKILDKLVRNYLVEVQGDRFTLPDLMIECILDKYQDSIAEEIWTKKLDLLHIYPILPSSTDSMIAKLTKKSLNTQSRQKILSQICARHRSPINIKDDLVARLTEIYTRLDDFSSQNTCTPHLQSVTKGYAQHNLTHLLTACRRNPKLPA